MSRGGRREGAGRPKGAVNKKSQEISDLLASLGVDPIEGMALIASNNKSALGISDDVPIAIRAQMFKELAPYVAYKLKAIEIGVDESSFLFPEDRLAHLR